MKRMMNFLSVLVLTLTGVVQLSAQTVVDGDAFYIYRNDGDFNGFFYDNVQEMRFSRFDLDMVEHDEYVVQEVVTPDSIYRIPLAAIDSIGFVQPEIKYNPRLRHMDELGMTPYVKSAYGLVILFDGLPSSMQPQVGDVLVGFDETTFGNGGFGGKVTSVKDTSDGLQVICTELTEVSDVFEQFITIEQVGKTPDGQNCRRIAGIKGLRRADGNFDVSVLNLSGTLQKEWKPNEKTSITFGLNLGFELKLSVCYNITWSKFFIKLVFNEGFEVGASVKAAVETGGEENFPYGPDGDLEIKFPANLPMFGIRPVPKAFVRCKGELSATINFPKFKWGSSQTIIFDADAEKFMQGYLSDQDCPTEDEDLLSGFSGGFAWNGFFQTGIKEDAVVNTNSWFKGIFYCSYGMEIYAGPKLEGEVNLSIDGLANDGAYGLLKDSKLEYTIFSVDLENKARMKYLWHDPEERTFFSFTKKFGTSTWYLFPEFKKTDVSFDKKTGIVTAAIHPRRKVFWKSWVGARIFNIANPTYPVFVADKFKEDESYNLFNTFNEFKAEFTDLKCGRYRVMPALRTLDCVVLTYSGAEEIEVPPSVDVETRQLNLSQASTIKNVKFTTNAPDIVVMAYNKVYSPESQTFTYYGMSDEDAWLGALDLKDESNPNAYEVMITVDENKSLFSREGAVVIFVNGGAGLTASDTIFVSQTGGNDISKVTINPSCWVKYSGTRTDEGVITLSDISGNDIFTDITVTRNKNILTIHGKKEDNTSDFTDESQEITQMNIEFSMQVDASFPTPHVVSCDITGTYNRMYQYYKFISENREMKSNSKMEKTYKASFKDIPQNGGGIFIYNGDKFMVSLEASHKYDSTKQDGFTGWKPVETHEDWQAVGTPDPTGQYAGIYIGIE